MFNRALELLVDGKDQNYKAKIMKIHMYSDNNSKSLNDSDQNNNEKSPKNG